MGKKVLNVIIREQELLLKYRVSAVLFVISPKVFMKYHFTHVPKDYALQSTFDCSKVSMTDQLTSARALLFKNGHSALHETLMCIIMHI